ncbi:MAG: oxidoreductase [Candidatus Marinimicrobia bacterium]|jgi:F420-non-reducing hydrogenase small subunit|nr:oxidoreductase [Candidatus Neomarinimicrobiota bacterium]
MKKPKIAFYWCASCGGCEEAIVDLAEDILPIVDAVDIVMWPVAMDFKKSDIEKLKDNEIVVSFINGAIRTDEQEEMVKLFRKKSQMIIAFGSCAHLGGIPALMNLKKKSDMFKTIYSDLQSVENPKKTIPQVETKIGDGKVTLPAMHEEVKTLDQVIDVEYYIPGCAPPPDIIKDSITAILQNKLPEKGTVLGATKSLCDTCPRKDSKPEKIKIKEIKRMPFVKIDDDKCFLAESVICMGPATISGCGERCINANMPCRGCFGPTKLVSDQGAKFLSALASIIDSEDEDEIKNITDSVIDPAGLFYMYSLASSLGAKYFENKD